MKKLITAYRVGAGNFGIRRAPHTRQWMDETNQKYAYRCLPLVAANCYGWELLCPETVTATWDGRPQLDAIDIVPKREFLVSHFGYGIVTFHIPFLFRTSGNADLLVSGPVNTLKEWALPLEGIVESSWSTMTFTMNWVCMIVGKPIIFEKGEPICRIAPVARNFLKGFAAEIVENADIPPEVTKEFENWSERRRVFLEQLKVEDSAASGQGWQKTYYKQAKLTRLPEFQNSCPAHSS